MCQLKDMLKGTQVEVKISELLDKVLEQVDPNELDFYIPAKDWVIVEPVVTEEVPINLSPKENK